MKVIIESQYFPNVTYLSFLKRNKEVWIDTKEHFIKQTYRNRCYILGSNKTLPLAIPIKNGNKKVPMDQIQIDYTHSWIKNHWRAITSAYNKSPYFEYYEPYIQEILFKKPDRLLDLNKQILSFCLKILNIDTQINFTDKYESISENDQIEDMRSVIHPKKDYICRRIYDPIPYHQMFGKKFVENLSILDLLSNCGPESDTYL